MKKLLMILLLTVVVIPVFAELPQSIEMESGKLKVRLDARKKWNINRIEWNGHLCGIDATGAHYGMAYQPYGSRFFIGSGHNESGLSERVMKITFFADGRKIASCNQKICGKTVSMEKVSKVEAFTVRYSFSIRDDILSEKTEISADIPVKVNYLYCFMHPWSVRFTQFYALRRDGERVNLTFRSDESFLNRDFLPAAAWYDPASGIGLATVITLDKGSMKAQRFIWDRAGYHKDYLCDFSHADFPAGHVARYTANTGFFQQPDSVKWITEAESLFQKLR
ncbi:MAG: hypothetical protein ACI4UV_08090 [Victivallales bacterium]